VTSRRASALTGGIGLAVAVALTWRTWRSPGTRNVGGTGDMQLIAWSLRWVPWAMAHGHNPLFTRYLDSPSGVNLMWNPSLPLAGVVLAPVTVLAGPVVAYNALATGALAAAAWSASRAFGRLVARAWVAIVAGLAYGFSPSIIGQTIGNHVHLTAAAAVVPLLALAVWDGALGRRWSAPVGGLLIGVGGAAVLLLSEELFALSVVAALVGAAAFAAGRGAGARAELSAAARGAVAPALFAVVVFAALAGPALAVQFGGGQRLRGPSFPARAFSADAAAWVVPGPQALLGASRAAAEREPVSYLGAPVLTLAAAAAWRGRLRLSARASARNSGPKRARMRSAATASGIAALTTAILALLALGPPAIVWTALIGHLPLLRFALPIRLSLFVTLGALGLCAVAIDKLALARPRAAVAALVVVVLSLLPRLPLRSSPTRVPSFFGSPAVARLRAGRLAIVAPRPGPGHPEAMLWQAVAGMRWRSEGGFALRPGPRGRTTTAPAVTPSAVYLEAIEEGRTVDGGDPAVADALRAEIASGHVDEVIVGPMRHREAAVALFSALLGAPNFDGGGVTVWDHLQPR